MSQGNGTRGPCDGGTWKPVTLGGIVSLRRERANPQERPDDPFIGLGDVEPHTMELTHVGRGADAKSSAAVFQAGDVLYSRLRPYLNKVVRPDFAGIASAEFLVLEPSHRVDGDFLALRLHSSEFVDFAASLNAGDRPRVKFEQIAEFELLLPSLQEQELIMRRLKSQRRQIADADGLVDKADAELPMLRRSVLAAAIAGSLVTSDDLVETGDDVLARIRDQRAELERTGKRNPRRTKKGKPPAQPPYEPPAGWAYAPWKEVGYCQNGRAFPSKDYSDTGVKLLRPGNLDISGEVIWTEKNTRHLPDRYATEFPEFVVRGGELVINLTAQSLKDEFLGRVCLTSPGEVCLLNQRIARLTPGLLDPDFVFYVFRSPLFRDYVRGLNKGSLMQHMFTSEIEEFMCRFRRSRNRNASPPLFSL